MSYARTNTSSAHAQVTLQSGDEVTIRAKTGQYSFIADLAKVEASTFSQPQSTEIAGTNSAAADAAATATAALEAAAAAAATGAAAAAGADSADKAATVDFPSRGSYRGEKNLGCSVLHPADWLPLH